MDKLSKEEVGALECFDEAELAEISRELRMDGVANNIRTICAALRRLAGQQSKSGEERVCVQHIENLVEFVRNAPRTYRDHDEPDPQAGDK